MEIFKAIEGYEGLYEVSNFGNVKSLKKEPSYKGASYLDERILKKYKRKYNHTSYEVVGLSKNRKVKTLSVHRLVAKAFIPNPKNKCCINHIDNNGLNNHVDNLEWVTHKENMIHSSKQGRQDSVRKLGGIALGEKVKKEAELRWNARINKIFGMLKIIKIISLGKHPKGIVECQYCEKQYESSLDAIITRKPNGCRSCALKHKNRMKI